MSPLRFLFCIPILFFAFNAESIAEWPSGQVDSWHGFVRRHFEVEGCKAWVVEPKKAAEGKPWTWCMEFPDAFTERTGVLSLLDKGFHHVHISVGNTFGSPTAIKQFEAFHRTLVQGGLAQRGTLIGISRGGLYAYRFAANHPESILCIYGDAPVCDFKSWPGGKGTGKGSPSDWQQLIRLYGFRDESEAIAYTENPIDRLEPLAKAQISLIHVVGDTDDVVPISENTNLIEERFQKLGGKVLVLHKPNVGHHPHGLDDPSPVVDFIWREYQRSLAGPNNSKPK